MNEIFKIVTSLLSSSDFFDLFKGKEKKFQEFQLALLDKLNDSNMAQIELNKIEAKNTNLFVSGWRPAVGWICAFALAYNYILQPFLIFIVNLFEPTFEIPMLEIEQLISILMAMLGMYGIRSYEKIKSKS